MFDRRRTHWLLAFDASCCTCRSVSTVVSDACGEVISTVPLDRSDVVELRARAFGDDAPHRPTLLAVTDEHVRGYTGAKLATTLCRVLGVRRGTKVLRALGAAVREIDVDVESQAAASGLSRKGFLQLASGAAVAGGIVVFGNTTRAVATERERDVKAWAARNRSALPRDYDDIAAMPLDYRKAVYAELDPAGRRALWLTQLERFEKQQSPLDTEQRAAIASAREFLTSPHAGVLPHEASASELATIQRRATTARTAMERAFGRKTSVRALSVLGPQQRPTTSATTTLALPSCSCQQGNDLCFGSTPCTGGGCVVTQSGCGFAYSFACDGVCPD